ncbi:MAG: hypothetical protein OXD38_02725, partial [Aestuariivita sp.]|nr:hypothetical protein [Aestuariivita sp.]
SAAPATTNTKVPTLKISGLNRSLYCPLCTLHDTRHPRMKTIMDNDIGLIVNVGFLEGAIMSTYGPEWGDWGNPVSYRDHELSMFF